MKRLVDILREANEEPALANKAAQSDMAKQKTNPVTKAKIDLFFDSVQKNSTLMSYLRITDIKEQYNAIIRFSEMVGVPSNKIVSLLQNFRVAPETQE